MKFFTPWYFLYFLPNPGIGKESKIKTGATTHPDLECRYPHPELGWGYPSVLIWDGVPLSDLGWGCPPSWLRMVVPPVGKDGVPPIRKDGGTYPISQMGYPPKCGQTDTCENSTFPFPRNAGGNYLLWALNPHNLDHHSNALLTVLDRYVLSRRLPKWVLFHAPLQKLDFDYFWNQYSMTL